MEVKERQEVELLDGFEPADENRLHESNADIWPPHEHSFASECGRRFRATTPINTGESAAGLADGLLTELARWPSAHPRAWGRQSSRTIHAPDQRRIE